MALQANPTDSANSNTALYRQVPSLETATKSEGDSEKLEALSEWWNKHWLYECGACLLSLVFFIWIVVILEKYDHRRVIDWPYDITINTVVSILATALGSVLSVPVSEGLGQLKWLWFRSPRMIADIDTFDSATRGPLGAFQMLYKLRGIHLGAFGSFITIAALALSPFFQQVIAFQTRATVSSEGTSILRRNQFNLMGGGDHLDPSVNGTTQASVINGIFNPNPSAIQINPTCVSGNCTFSRPYSSLAVCSSCSNITKFIKKSVYYSMQEGNRTFNYYNYTLPNGVWIGDFASEQYISTQGSGDGSNTVWSGFAAPLSVVTTISSTNDALKDPEYVQILGPWAAQCVLYICVNTYTSTVVNGNLDERTLSTYFNESEVLYGTETGNNGSSGIVLTQKPCVARLESANSSYMVPEATANGTVNEAYDACVFYIQPLTFNALQNWLPSVFGPGSTLDFPSVIYNNNQSSFEFVESMMARVAISLTTHFRTYGIGDPASGTSSTLETYIEVRWDWLILPACIVSFSIIFLVATIVQSTGFDAWKSSSLALLFSSGVIDDQDKIVKLHEIEWIAKGRCAVLKKTAQGNVQLSREID